MSRLCRLKSYSGVGDDGKWAYREIIRLRGEVICLTMERDNLLAALKKALATQAYRRVHGPAWWDDGHALVERLDCAGEKGGV